MNPTFLEIWTSEGWTEFFFRNAPAKTREFYKFRSAVRMLVWIPITTATAYMALAIVSVYS